MLKLLAYSDDFEVVYGTRTVKELIWRGANMGLFLKWGNYAVAKLMEFLFNSTSLTDVGCTMRCIQRDALRRIEPFFTVDGSFFGPEMMVLSVLTARRSSRSRSTTPSASAPRRSPATSGWRSASACA